MGALICIACVIGGFALVSATYRKLQALREDYQYFVQDKFQM